MKTTLDKLDCTILASLFMHCLCMKICTFPLFEICLYIVIFLQYLFYVHVSLFFLFCLFNVSISVDILMLIIVLGEYGRD